MRNWAIKAVFENEGGEQDFTYYEEKKFLTKRGAIRALNSQYGELLAQAATLDTEIEEELAGFWLDDLTIYNTKREKAGK